MCDLLLCEVFSTRGVTQQIAARVAQNLESISQYFQFSTRRTRILMRFVISTMILPSTDRKCHRQNSDTLTKFQKLSQDSVPWYLQLAVTRWFQWVENAHETYVRVYTYANMFGCVCVCVCVYTYINVYIYIYTYIHICVDIYICIYTYLWKIYIYRYIYTHKQMSTCTYCIYISCCNTWKKGVMT